MIMYTYRNANDSDLSLICKFPQDKYELFNIYPAGTYPLTAEQLKLAVDARSDSTVILYDQEIVGFANFYVVEKGLTCSIGNAIVKPSMRGKGVGKFLIRTMIEIAKKKYNVKEVEISCFSNNTTGLLLYTQLGFKPDFIDKATDPDGNVVARINFKLQSK
jgi:ribosomal protein S18 acetylase RimI-like enzyme